MKLNRRSVLGTIGMIGVGTGAAFGSGAFTTVEAQREVEVNVIGGGFRADGIIHLADDPLDNVSSGDIAKDADGIEYDDGQTIGDVESTISNEIIGSSGTADVLVNTASDFVTVKDANDDEFDGRSLYPTLDNTYESTNGSYVSLVANDVTIVFGPEDRKLPPNSNLSETELFGVVRNGDADVTFAKGDVDEGLLTNVNGNNVSTSPRFTGSGNVTLSGDVQAGEASRETEDLLIKIDGDS
ncbi:hypothetical protein [Halorubrum distributum]|uniref:Uncharacterized protein n=3 Tax=Halorubrum distributum TaxID=29283 RepID=M0NLP9_9EURY|nr:hypothetical protein [Halorubrum terrestre]EMA57595.1 hypothetical protein C470_15053 [Halorubrum litoreum JCM 13561]MYL17771.1 hypothetical protein [Halorubrum terrestre]MYL68950.1 hypothetical protein [Halorubrum terrestre]